MSMPHVEHARLRDGAVATIRPYADGDRPELESFVRRLSGESRRLRFHSAGVRVDPEALLGGHGARRLVAIVGGELAGVACYIPLTAPGVAEVALAVRDDDQGRGVGTRLVEQLAADARREGLQQLLAAVLSDNRGMLGVLGSLGFREHRRVASGEVEVLVDLSGAQVFEDARDRRDHVGALASLRGLLEPRAVAVVGASRDPLAIGHAVFRNLLAGDFPGPVYPVNPAAESVAGVAAYATLAAIGRPIDLAVICIPAEHVLASARACAEHGVGALVVISAGFAEASPEGRAAQDELVALCRDAGMRLLGPNCLGVLVNRPGFVLDATFAGTRPPFGNLAIASQSGALGIAVLEQARSLGIGVSLFASTGNKADISSNDLLEAFEEDEATQVVALYVESFGNPRRFARIARRLSARKPIVAVKSGRSPAGQRAALSHTGALAASDQVVSALFEQAGVIRTQTLDELFSTVLLLATQPLPGGNRVAVVTNAGGLGILAADAAASSGLELPALHARTLQRTEQLLGPGRRGNPLDTLAGAGPGAFAQVVRFALEDPNVDACVALYAPTRVVTRAEVASALANVQAAAPSRPLVTCVLGAPDPLGTGAVVPGGASLTGFAFPESAVRALGHAARLSAYRRRPLGVRPPLQDVHADAARTICRTALAHEDSVWLSPPEVDAVLAALGIRTLDLRVARSPEQAGQAFAELGGGPVAAKLLARGVVHKSEVGGVRLGVSSAAEAARTFAQFAAALHERGLDGTFEGVLLQPMAPPGVECLVGVATDPTFGPVVAFGVGGVLAELMGGTALRITPLTDQDADDMVEGSTARRLLAGYRGGPPGDVDAVRDVILRVARLAEEVAEVAELDLNPLLALQPGDGAVAVDARIRVARA